MLRQEYRSIFEHGINLESHFHCNAGIFNGILHFCILPNAAVSPVVHGKRRKRTSGGHVQSFTLSMSFLHCVAHSVSWSPVFCPRCTFRKSLFCSQVTQQNESFHTRVRNATRQKDFEFSSHFLSFINGRLFTPLTVFLFSHDGAGLSSASELPAFLQSENRV